MALDFDYHVYAHESQHEALQSEIDSALSEHFESEESINREQVEKIIKKVLKAAVDAKELWPQPSGQLAEKNAYSEFTIKDLEKVWEKLDKQTMPKHLQSEMIENLLIKDKDLKTLWTEYRRFLLLFWAN
jgi:hypothetical protein